MYRAQNLFQSQQIKAHQIKIKLSVLFACLLIIPYAYASIENYNNYKSLEVEVNVSSYAEPIAKSINGKIEIINISILFYPAQNYMQKIIEEVHAITAGGIINKNEDSLNFVWNKPKITKYEFSYDYKIRTYNDLLEVDKKIKFPLVYIDDDLKKYVMPYDYIDINEDIKKKAAEIVEGEDDYYIAVFKLADWVNRNINYSLTTLTEDVVEKSSWVLENKYGVCDELTNLFISMARSLGIPARFVVGTAYTNMGYKFGNHGWAEVYFPGYGWLPYDVTYGQYGWIDPGHIKLGDFVDSNGPSIKYNWRSYDVELKTYSLNIEGRVIKSSDSMDNLVDFKVSPLIDAVDFGSYMPIEIDVKNLKPYYVTANFRITKAPGVYGGIFSKSTALKSNEEKKIYWILEAPIMEDQRFIYTSEVEIVDNFNYAQNTKIKYASIYEKYDLNYANDLINGLAVDSTKEAIADIDFSCSTPKKNVYSDENTSVYCNISNIGTKNLNNVNICLFDDCKNFVLLIGEKKDFIMNRNFKSSMDAVVKAYYNNDIRYSKLRINVVKKPVLMLKKNDNVTIDYNEWRNLTIELTTNTKINNIVLHIDGFDDVAIDDLDGRYVLVVPIKGKIVYGKNLNIEINYNDELGKNYKLNNQIKYEVAKLPWYAWFL